MYCTACQFFYPVLILYNGTCRYNCPPGTYFNSISLICSNCATNCTECYSDNIVYCLKCKDGMVFYNGQCLSSCPSGYTAGQDGKCVQCPTGCLTCNTVGDCFSCITTLTLVDYKCKDNCTSLGQYLSGSSCAACPSICQTCNNQSSCIKCNNSLYLTAPNSILCVTQCLGKTFPDNSTFLCTPCPPTCATCTSTSNCTSCLTTSLIYYYLYNGTCLYLCPNNTYMDFFDYTTRICKACAPECSVCFGATNSQCIACTKGYILDMTACVRNCTIGKYVDNTSHCDTCNLICQTCFGPSDFQCLSCNYEFYLYKFRCYEICPAGTVNVTIATPEWPSLKICRDCPTNCLICLENGQCTVCAPMTYLTNDKLCKDVCPYGWTVANDSVTCNQCPGNCLTCTASGCTSCITGFYLYNYN